MTPTLSLFVALIVGVACGAAVALWSSRAGRRAEIERAVAQAQAETRQADTGLHSRVAAAEARAERVPLLEADLAAKETALDALRQEVTQLKTREASFDEQIRQFRENEKSLKTEFEALSGKALAQNNEVFLKLAEERLKAAQQLGASDLEARRVAIDALLKPMTESLEKVDGFVRKVEQDRVGAYGELKQQVSSMAEVQRTLQSETANLVKALRAPAVRGRWGEIQLKRVVEMAGMLDHCDFYEQQSTDTEEGRLRPDMIVRLPGGKTIVVDSKVPLEAYLRAQETQDDAEHETLLVEHSRQVRDHIGQLSRKSYWEQFESTPELVVMFLPGEPIWSSALRHDPALIEYGADQKVLLASPITLIGLLRSVAYGWRQEQIAENSQKIGELGKDLYNRIRAWSEHMVGVGKGLDRAVAAYNSAVGSLESRVLPGARQFKELGAGSGEDIPEAAPLERAVREVEHADLRMLPGGLFSDSEE